MTLEEVYRGLSRRKDTVTEELITIGEQTRGISERLDSVESLLAEVELDIGGGRTIKKPRIQLMQEVYDHIRPGGVLDRRLEQCSDDHDPVKRLREAGDRYDVYWKWGQRILLLLMSVFLVYELTTGRKDFVREINANAPKTEKR